MAEMGVEVLITPKSLLEHLSWIKTGFRKYQQISPVGFLIAFRVHKTTTYLTEFRFYRHVVLEEFRNIYDTVDYN